MKASCLSFSHLTSIRAASSTSQKGGTSHSRCNPSLDTFLVGRHFTLITDQKSVSYMYNYKSSDKIKNDKTMRCRVALSPFSYYIQFRPGKYNNASDTLTRVICDSISLNSLHDIHTLLYHSGVTRLNHFIKTKNLPYSLDNIKQVCMEWKNLPRG